MSFKRVESSPIYQLALKATQEIDSPAAGFEKPAEAGQIGPSLAKVIKQNNLLIYLLVTVSEQLQSCQEDITRLTSQSSKGKDPDPEFEEILQSLQNKLEGLSLKEPVKKRKEAPFYVFKDPKLIFEEEKAKLKGKTHGS